LKRRVVRVEIFIFDIHELLCNLQNICWVK
jgi:hypothetical protein